MSVKKRHGTEQQPIDLILTSDVSSKFTASRDGPDSRRESLLKGEPHQEGHRTTAYRLDFDFQYFVKIHSKP